ncbi:hypothetical protein AMECASPLE_009457 [Ameca splendens]|uniref:Uncharacterized protein n=1 Tax=Ameca splendens TaxID=208324 RepID=A0ABV0YB64_9TELE
MLKLPWRYIFAPAVRPWGSNEQDVRGRQSLDAYVDRDDCLQAVRCNRSLFCNSQHELGPSFGLVSSAQRGAFLSWPPRGGEPAAASDTGQEGEPGGWDGTELEWKEARWFQETDMCWSYEIFR